MSKTSNRNRRIAKNTLLLYFRMILVMLVTFYTSRVILDKLGIEDFGIYNVVGGVVMMFAFLNNSMTTATQRFLTFEIGKGNDLQLNKVFSTALSIHILIALIIVLLAETIGLWFLNYKLNIPVDRMVAANWVYQFSILTFCTNIIQVPYNASLMAHEEMNIFAYVSIVEVFLKLAIVYMLSISPVDRLILYSVLVFIVQLIIRTVYQMYCRKSYSECHFRIYWDKILYKQISGFASWNIFGSLAWLFRDQGLNILLNIFFGPGVNAARGITLQVTNGVMGFITNFQVALNPQITKLYAVGERREMEKLVYRGLKFSFLLLFFIALPLMLNVDFILKIWLTEVPEFSNYFIILVMIDALANVLFGNPLMTSLAATGRIRSYQVVVSIIILLIVPLGYVLLKMEYDAPAVFYVMIIITLVSGFIRYLFCRKQIGFSLNGLFHVVILPIVAMILCALPLPLFLRLFYLTELNLKNFIILCFVSAICAFLSSLFVAIRKVEREAILEIIKRKIKTING